MNDVNGNVKMRCANIIQQLHVINLPSFALNLKTKVYLKGEEASKENSFKKQKKKNERRSRFSGR
jgi:hypothetical protein